jgi:hypothetical protein
MDVSATGAFKEALQAQLISRIWADDTLKQEILIAPEKVLERETGAAFPTDINIKILEEGAHCFYFIVPHKPVAETEISARLEQMSGWWMAAHTTWWWASRLGLANAEAFREALSAMIIGHIWMNDSFRQAMLTDPKTALTKEIGIEFPPELNIKTLEETSKVKYLVLPKSSQDYKSGTLVEQPSEWWMITHTFWSWLIWLRLHTPISSH